jgi:hypothetical protein
VQALVAGRDSQCLTRNIIMFELADGIEEVDREQLAPAALEILCESAYMLSVVGSPASSLLSTPSRMAAIAR